MKGNTKRNLKYIFAAAFIMILAMGTIALTGCGGSGGGSEQAEEPEPIINPITGVEIESEDALPARPVQVSIPNDTYGAIPQSNITQADIIYEFPVEGELTRLQAIYYGEIPDKFGPIRSVRYYFVDVATEYKACHIGYGWGKHARSYMNSNNVHHVNGMQQTELFYRVSDKSAPNNAYTNWEDVKAFGEKHDWFTEKQVIEPWTFRNDKWAEEQKAAKKEAQATIEEKSGSTEEEDVKAVEKAEAILAEPEKATELTVKALGCNSTCKWDPEKGKYLRYWYGEPYVDKETGEQLEFDNILVQKVHSDIMVDDETGLTDHKGRLTIDMFAGGDALLFTQGEVIEGTWSRDGVDSRTIFKDKAGRDFAFTPGKTWVYVLDQDKDFSYENNAADDTEDAEDTEETGE